MNKQYILDNLAQLAQQNAVIYSTTAEQSQISLVTFVRTADDPGAPVTAIIKRGGTTQVDNSLSLDELRQKLASQDDTLDRAILPRSFNSSKFRLTDLPIIDEADVIEVFAGESDKRKVVGKRVAQVPIYLAGPAAGLSVDPDVISLIPNIPENSQGIFVSQPNVVAAAGKLAVISRPLPTKADTIESTDESPTMEFVALNIVLDLEGPEAIDTKLTSAAQRLTADEMLKLGLGISFKRADVKVPALSDKKEPRSLTISATLDKDRNQLVFNFVGSADSRIASELANGSTDLVSSPLVTNALLRMLNGRNVERINIDVPYDERGAQIDAIDINVQREQKARAKKQTRADRRNLVTAN